MLDCGSNDEGSIPSLHPTRVLSIFWMDDKEKMHLNGLREPFNCWIWNWIGQNKMVPISRKNRNLEQANFKRKENTRREK